MLFIVPSIFLWAQVRTVTGKVTNEKSEPVAYATVKEVGNGKNVAEADENGNFSIKLKAGAKLTVSYNEYTPYSFTPVDGFNAVTLKGASVQKLQDVVVTTAMGVKKQKKELGYATTQVSGTELNKGKSPNIASALAGKVSGLAITQTSSGVNNDVRVILRGNRSLAGNNQPILVVDGSIVDIGYINNINPNDIENVNILKGAGATAVYGNEASNGAILITTKKGSKNKPVITFSSSVTQESVSFMPKLQNSFGPYGGEAVDSVGNPMYVPYENQSYGPKYDGHMVPLGLPVQVTTGTAGTPHDSTWMVPYSSRPDEKRNFFANAYTYKNDVSFSNSDGNGGSFFVSVENLKRTGTTPGDQSTRNTIRLNASKELSKFTVGFNIDYTKSTSNTGWVGIDNFPMYYELLNSPSFVPINQLKDVVNNPFATPSGYYNAYYDNPYWIQNNSRIQDWSDVLLGNVNFSYKPTSWMSADYRVSYTANFDQNQTYRAGVTYASWLLAETAHDPFGDASFGPRYKQSSINAEGYTQNYTTGRLQGDFALNLHHTFNDFSTKLILGQTVYQIKTNEVDQGYNPVTGSINSYDNLGVGGPWGPAYAIGQPIGYNYNTTRRVVGIFGDFTVGYKNYLFLHASIRNDWDSRLEAANRSFSYPAADLSFVFTDAIDFFKKLTFLSAGKIRLSVAKVGNISVGPYETRNVYKPSAALGFPYTNAAGNAVSGYSLGTTLYNPNIGPEFTTEKETGLELAWLKNRLITDFSYYIQNTTNQTLSTNISSATGRPYALQNIGEVQNNGLELDVKGTIIQKKNVQWVVGVNYTHFNNKVVSIAPGITQLALNTTTDANGTLGGGIYAVQGNAYPYLMTTDWNRDPSGHIIVDANTGTGSKSTITKGFGTTQAPNSIGMSTSVSYKRFTISAVAEYRYGAVMLNALGTTLDFSGVSANSAAYNRQPFIVPNSVINVGGHYVPNTSVYTNNASGSVTDAYNFFTGVYNTIGSNYVTSANFWKLREVNISYEIPEKFLAKSKFIKTATVSLIGRDLLMLLPKENMWTDPEFSNTTGNGTGITNEFQTPPTRKVGVSLNVIF